MTRDVKIFKIWENSLTNNIQYLSKVALELGLDFEVVVEFGFEVAHTKFDKSDMREWMKKDGQNGSKKSKKLLKFDRIWLHG